MFLPYTYKSFSGPDVRELQCSGKIEIVILMQNYNMTFRYAFSYGPGMSVHEDIGTARPYFAE